MQQAAVEDDEPVDTGFNAPATRVAVDIAGPSHGDYCRSSGPR